jgi:hypothetical protein
VGDQGLTDALAECNENGWEALPVAAREMARLFPSVWATKKAAERWSPKTPQGHIEIQFGFGGV